MRPLPLMRAALLAAPAMLMTTRAWGAPDAGLTPPAPATARAPMAPATARATPRAIAPGPLRSANAILADSVKATGGDAPWKTHHAIETKTQIEYAKMAIGGIRTQTVTAKNQALAITLIPNVGQVKEGTNGRVIWSEDPVNGLRLLKGAEAAQFRLESTWNVERHMNKLFPKIVVKADTDAGRALECLELTPTAGQPITICYDAETHLQALQKGTAATPQGDVPFTSRIKTWRDAGGLKLPEVVEMTTGPIEFSARLIDVAFDKPVADKLFEVPAQKARAKAKDPATGRDDAPAN